MKKILTILFVLISTISFAQIGIVNYDTIQSKAIQADSALWIKYLENGGTDTLLTHIDGKVAYVLPSEFLLTAFDSTNFRITEEQISNFQNYQLDSDTLDWDATRTWVNDLLGNEGFTNAHEADPLFKNWNRTDGINIFSKQIMDFDTIHSDYALLEDITDGIRDADFTSLAINGTDLAAILNDTADNVRSEIPTLLTELDSTNFKITENQISDLQNYQLDSDTTLWDATRSWVESQGYITTQTDDQTLAIDSTGRVFTISIEDGNSVVFEDTNTQLLQSEVNAFETDPVYAADSLQIQTDIQNNADSIAVYRTDINQNATDIAALEAVNDAIETFTANSGQTSFTLANNPSTEYTVSQNGVILPPSAYTITTNTLAINVGVWENDRIQINYKY